MEKLEKKSRVKQGTIVTFNSSRPSPERRLLNGQRYHVVDVKKVDCTGYPMKIAIELIAVDDLRRTYAGLDEFDIL